jgi:hypothetical protein
MASPIRWLEAQLEKAKQDMEEAQKRYEALAETLRIARAEQGIMEEEREASAPVTPNPIKRTRGKAGMTMPDQIEQILKEHGPLSSSEIYEIIKEKRETTVNSITTQLNRYKAERFRKEGDNKWFLAVQRKDGPEQTETVFE